MRNLLSSTLAYIELLPKNPAKQTEFLLGANSCGNMALNFLYNILYLSSLEKKMTSVNIIDSDIFEVINRVMMAHKMQAKNKGIYFNMIRDNNIPPCLKIDIKIITQILNNLIMNSFRFTHKGLVVIKLTWFPITKNNYSKKDIENGMEEALMNSSRDEIINSVDEDLGTRMLSKINMKVNKKIKEYKGKPRILEDSLCEAKWLQVLDQGSNMEKEYLRYIYIYIYV